MKRLTKVRHAYLLFISILSVLFMAGCGGGGGGETGHWDGPPAPSTATPPAVTFTVPLNNAAEVPIGNKVSATFTTEMEQGSLNPSTFIVLKTGTMTPVDGAVSYAGITAVFTPTASLDASTIYTARITTGAKDLAGTPLASDYEWSFKTGLVPDVTAPTVTLTVPVASAPAVATNTTISATFSEAMDPLTITATLPSTFTVQDKLTTIAVLGTVTYSGVTAVFTPSSDLVGNRTYTARITTAAKDLALIGNALAADYVWEFTTGAAPDIIRPTVTLTVPADAAGGVATNATVTATFSEAMKPSTVTNQIFTVKQGATVIGGAVLYAGVSAVFTPTSPLEANKTYIARITTVASDLALNTMASDYVWSFTTGAAPDTTKPTVTLTVPAGNDTGVATNTTVAATFSEPMDPVKFTNLTFTVLDGGTTVNGTVIYSGLTAVFTPLSTVCGPNILCANTLYTARVTSALTDLALTPNALAGNQAPLPAASDYVWQFTTGAAPDAVAPLITVTNPADLDINVPIDQKINATFSEKMKPLTMVTANFKLKETLTQNDISGTVSYDIENNIATFSPLLNLTPDMDYTVTVSNDSKDLADNALVVPAAGLPNNPWTFRTAAAVVPPEPLAINLRGIASFGIASRAGLTSTGVTVINGDVALYPLATCTDSTGNSGASQTCLVHTYASPTGMTVNGSIYWAGDPFDNGGTANSVTNDLNVAWVEGKNKTDTQGSIAADEMGGKTFLPGVYHNSNLGLAAGTFATLDGNNNANSIFIFKVDSSFVDSGTQLLKTEIKLINGAQAKNVWFVAGLDVTIGSGTNWKGNILAGRTATINDGSTLLGRVLAGASGAGSVTLVGAASPSVTTITVPQ